MVRGRWGYLSIQSYPSVRACRINNYYKCISRNRISLAFQEPVTVFDEGTVHFGRIPLRTSAFRAIRRFFNSFRSLLAHSFRFMFFTIPTYVLLPLIRFVQFCFQAKSKKLCDYQKTPNLSDQYLRDKYEGVGVEKFPTPSISKIQKIQILFLFYNIIFI